MWLASRGGVAEAGAGCEGAARRDRGGTDEVGGGERRFEEGGARLEPSYSAQDSAAEQSAGETSKYRQCVAAVPQCVAAVPFFGSSKHSVQHYLP